MGLLDVFATIAATFGERELIPQPRWSAMEAYARGKAFGMVKVWNEALLGELRDSLVTAQQEGTTPREWSAIADGIGAKYGVDLELSGAGTVADAAYADLVFRMGEANASADGTFAALFDDEGRSFSGYWRYLAIRDDRNDEQDECPNIICRGLHGSVFSKDDAEATAFWPPVHFNCFPGSTRVVAAAARGFRAAYAGPVVTLETERGERLTLTVNHPVLTPAGWVPAERLQRGDYVIANPLGVEGGDTARRLLEHASLVSRADRDAVSAVGVDFNDRPTTAAELFGSLGEGTSLPLPGIRMRPVDFNGDARFFDGDVEAKDAFRKLLRHDESPRAKRFRNLVLKAAEATKAFMIRLRGAFHFGAASLPTGGGRPCLGALALDGRSIGLQAGPLQQLGFGLTSKRDASLGKGLLEQRAGHAGSVGNALQTLAVSVGVDQPRGEKAGPLGGVVLPKALGAALTRLSGVHRSDFRGDVYDFETAHGAILAESIVVSNCRCYTADVPASLLDRRGWDVTTGAAAIALVGLPPDGFGASRSPEF